MCSIRDMVTFWDWVKAMGEEEESKWYGRSYHRQWKGSIPASAMEIGKRDSWGLPWNFSPRNAEQSQGHCRSVSWPSPWLSEDGISQKGKAPSQETPQKRMGQQRRSGRHRLSRRSNCSLASAEEARTEDEPFNQRKSNPTYLFSFIEWIESVAERRTETNSRKECTQCHRYRLPPRPLISIPLRVCGQLLYNLWYESDWGSCSSLLPEHSSRKQPDPSCFERVKELQKWKKQKVPLFQIHSFQASTSPVILWGNRQRWMSCLPEATPLTFREAGEVPCSPTSWATFHHKSLGWW